MTPALYATRSICTLCPAQQDGREFAVIRVNDLILRKLRDIQAGVINLRDVCESQAAAPLRQIQMVSPIEVAWVGYGVLHKLMGEVSTQGMDKGFVCIGPAKNFFPEIKLATRCALPADMIFDG